MHTMAIRVLSAHRGYTCAKCTPGLKPYVTFLALCLLVVWLKVEDPGKDSKGSLERNGTSRREKPGFLHH